MPETVSTGNRSRCVESRLKTAVPDSFDCPRNHSRGSGEPGLFDLTPVRRLGLNFVYIAVIRY